MSSIWKLCFFLQLSNGTKKKFTLKELIAVLLHKHNFSWAFGTIIALTLIGFYDQVTSLTKLGTFLFVSFHVFLAIILFLLFIVLIIIGLARAGRPLSVYTGFPMAASAIIVTLIGFSVLYFLKAFTPKLQDIVSVMLFNVIFSELLTTIFYCYISDKILEEKKSTNPAPKELAIVDSPADGQQTFLVEISGLKLDPQKIRYIRSDMHFLEIYLATEVFRVRGKMSLAVDQLREYGFSPHRSYWVNEENVTGIEENERGKFFIRVGSNEKIPVAGSKVTLVKHALREHRTSLGSRLIDHQSQNKTVAARATTDRKTFGHLS